MTRLSPDERNALYTVESERVGIHKSILAGLYEVQQKPQLQDGETGLGISPANRIALESVDEFEGQVIYAANTIRVITDTLISQGWQGDDLWDTTLGYYSKKFIERVAEGYSPPPQEVKAARLEPCDGKKLYEIYVEDLQTDYSLENLPSNLSYLDIALLSLVERIPQYYQGLPHQRDGLLEVFRIWRNFDTREEAIAALTEVPPSTAPNWEETHVDPPLLQFLSRLSRNYLGYPHQREALIRLTQLWRNLDSREEAISSLERDTSPEPALFYLDPALIAFAQRVPQYYTGRGYQRQALTEAFRIWRKLSSRTAALADLGLEVKMLRTSSTDPNVLANTAAQLDRELLGFIKRVPFAYTEEEHQRNALIRMVQLWRGLDSREIAIYTLFEDLKRMNNTHRNSPDAPRQPGPVVLPPRPSRWTPDNIQLHASIIPGGYFTWAEATHGGTRVPPNQSTVNAIVRIAVLAQQARDRIGRPFFITSWYRPPDINHRVGGVSNSRHIVGDAIDFYCDGLTGNQIYWFLDPWWPGGLGRYQRYPYIAHIDARSYRARWIR
ncbi:D-Ala-D-Ala carboxypeptidase family metallohydrolase [Roseofilum capinflatum]|uniref:D-Ala-D-Ala carboxypeptidase family metallohydrolase n=1 Tax=Roseofilum capinflatum BLCC-M114 TaxID=3022440 RepID=A0ABT7B718_9CYAN|nr:D-Ala-D-Ala carboxypeptidase family metallohydrolase [Roseofilum capinflatum]MDJ1174954.1 D-Ala-D-Ala carboxypeptidase family metallohydrolase [Roseofilum capinflatum BLCC-M114]